MHWKVSRIRRVQRIAFLYPGSSIVNILPHLLCYLCTLSLCVYVYNVCVHVYIDTSTYILWFIWGSVAYAMAPLLGKAQIHSECVFHLWTQFCPLVVSQLGSQSGIQSRRGFCILLSCVFPISFHLGHFHSLFWAFYDKGVSFGVCLMFSSD